jgi:two-component system phosphate regulon sensor histidine kinase PhoR
VLVFPAIVAAATRLGYYAWRQSAAQSQQSEQAIRQSNEAIADQVVSVIEKEIIASDHTLFDLIDLGNLKRFTDRWNEIVRLSPSVDAVLVLDDQQKTLAVVARGGKESRFQKLFERRILPDLHLGWLSLSQHAHLHSDYDGEQVLISYTHRRSGNRDYYIALSVDMQNVKDKLLPAELEDLRDTSRFSVVDSSGRIVYGDLLDRRGGFLYEKQFPSTLWRWRLQVAPKNIWQLISESRRRRLADAILISFAMVVILAGMAVLGLAMRKQRKASELKSEFIANVSHELKTPLSLIRMFSELMALGKVRSPEMGREYAEIITRESERLSRLIDNVLDFARIERGKAAYDFINGNLGDVVERALDVYRYRLEREKMKLRVDIENNLPLVRLDENAMTLALLNLLENAVKYAAPSPVAIRLRRADEWVALAVEDHGPGVPESDARRVFERFYRAPNARTRNIRGSGIGLSLVKHIAEAHGGRVTLAPTAGGGATFTITIPVESTLEAPTFDRSEESSPTPRPAEPARAPKGA